MTEDGHSVDLHEADGGSGLLRRHQPSLPQTARRTREATSCGRITGRTGLQINIGKAEAMRINNKQADPLRLHQENIKRSNSLSI